MTDEQRAAMLRHGWNPDHLPRGVSGPADFAAEYEPGRWMRNWVCELDGIIIDGHETSDLDYGGPCIHCGKEPEEWAPDD